MDYYRLTDDLEIPNRWYLRAPVLPSGDELDPRTFMEGRPVTFSQPLQLWLRRSGRSLDFTLADFDMPVATRAFANHLLDLAAGSVQSVPITVEGQADEFVILNLVRSVRCLDEGSSQIQWWTETNGRPDKTGQYRMVLNPTIDARRAAGFDLFRLGGWEIAIVCSGRVKLGLEATGFSGVAFTPLRTTHSGAAA